MITWTKTDEREFMFNIYRDRIGNEIPLVQQYWTLGGNCTLDDGTVNPDSEVSQVSCNGLALHRQIHSVDMDLETIEVNRAVYPEVNWYHNDFGAEMLQCDDFNPGFINLDTMSLPKAAIRELVTVMDSCEDVDHPMMLAFNVVSAYPRRRQKYTPDDIITMMNKSMTDTTGWSLHPETLVYKSAGRVSEMTTIILFKNI